MLLKRIGFPLVVFLSFFAFEAVHGVDASGRQLQPLVVRSVRHDVSPPLRLIQPAAAEKKHPPESPLHMPKAQPGVVTRGVGLDPMLDLSHPAAPKSPLPLAGWEGIDNQDWVYPPDTNGDAGPNHYVQWVNLHLAVWDKNGILLLGPVPGNTLWQGFGGNCENSNDGDPIVLYDHLADRWLAGQFYIEDFPMSECVAVSTSPDPTGSWYRYEFVWPGNNMPDYPKFGVWPDGYYMTANQFNYGGWAGAGVAVLQRTKMLNGQAAQMIYFDLLPIDSRYGGILPSDLDGPPPGDGTSNVFAEVDDDSVFGTDRLSLWEFHVDWTTPSHSSFGVDGSPNVHLDTAPFDWNLCNFDRNCIRQCDTSWGVDAISDRLMFRLQYRNFGSYSTLVTNHTVDVDGTDHAGVRWYELRNDGSGWSIFQQGTYAPDSASRWMGSVAMDVSGNIAAGYSVSSDTICPSIRYATRFSNDPSGQLSQGEVEVIAGSGHQQGYYSRWGDYSMMSVDPVNQCDFWYTQEYVQTTGEANWQTRVASFTYYPTFCSIGPTGTMQGTVTDSSTGLPLHGATVHIGASNFTTDPSGFYRIVISAGSYDVSASMYGYVTQGVSDVMVTDGGTTVQDFQLVPAQPANVTGTVIDAGGHGWPLYARIDIDGYPGGPVFTDRVTGAYNAQLYEGYLYTFQVSTISPGYLPEMRAVTPPAGASSQDFSLSPDSSTCTAPGYGRNFAYQESFESGNGGYNVTGTVSWQWGAPTSGPGNAHSGSNVWATNLSGLYNDGEDGHITSPDIDLSSLSGNAPVLEWWQWADTEASCDYIEVQVSKDGGSTWSSVYGPYSGAIDFSWTRHEVWLDSSYAVSGFRLRFHFYSDNSVVYDGWYIDDVGVFGAGCAQVPGGMLVGNVYDGNTNVGLNGATVAHSTDPAVATTCFSTPDDPNVDEGAYQLFSPYWGVQTFTASGKQHYQAQSQTPTVVADAIVLQNFSLAAGNILADPNPLEATVDMGSAADLLLNLRNTGGVPASFDIYERNGVCTGHAGLRPSWRNSIRNETPATAGTIAEPDARTSKDNPPLEGPKAAQLPAGDIIQIWPTGLPAAWGIAFDDMDESVWVDSPSASWSGLDALYEYSKDGVQTGRNWDHTWRPSHGPADAAFQWNTGMIWQMDVGGDNCIHEIDPAAGVTGNKICPGFNISQRGLAYDPVTDTWLAGGWNDKAIYRFDNSGAFLEQVYVGMTIAGLAFNPQTQHLFVMTNSSYDDVYVLDAANSYAIIGQFNIAGFGNYSGGGLEFGCDGSLWAVNVSTETVYQVQSGEPNGVCFTDVPWISEIPVSGGIPAAGTQPISVRFDAGVEAVNQPGDYQACLKIKTDTPYRAPEVQATMHVPLPPAWGTLQGTVQGLSMCDEPGAPLRNATVLVDGPLTDYALQTDASGLYRWSFDASNSPVTVTVSSTGYVTQARQVAITAQQVTVEDFALRLDASCLRPDVEILEATLNVDTNPTKTFQVILTNTGAHDASFSIGESMGNTNAMIQELKMKMLRKPRRIRGPAKPSTSPARRAAAVPGRPADSSTSRGLPHRKQPSAPRYRAGDVIQSWPTHQDYSWGIAVDDFDQTVWVDCPGPYWHCDNQLDEYTPAGAATGRKWSHDWAFYGPADGAFQWNTGMIWLMDVGQDNCIHEIDPASGETGNKICPGWEESQRGLAYDPLTDTWLAGGWNDYTIYRFDNTGAFLEEIYVGLDIAGLAFNPETQHLFVMTNNESDAVYVLDVANQYAVLGQFAIQGFGFYAGAGLEIGCDGTLWAVNQNEAMAYQVESGEQTTVCLVDIPWLSEDPLSGTVPANGGTLNLQVTFSAIAPGVAGLGDYLAHLRFETDNADRPPDIQAIMHLECPDNALFCDDFEDNVQPNFDILKPDFWETNGNYVGTPVRRKAEAIATPAFNGCSICSVESTVHTGGGELNKVWLLGWYANPANLVELMIKEESDVIILRQKIGGTIVAKAKTSRPITPNVFNRYRVDFDGSLFRVYMDGQLILSMAPGGPVQPGTVGFRAKRAIGTFGEIVVR